MEASLTEVDEVVLGVIEEELFNDGSAEAAINRAVQSLTSDDTYAQRENDMKAELQQIEEGLARLTEAIVAGGQLQTVLNAIREREERRTQVQHELSALRAAASTRVHPDALREQFNARLKEWRGLLRQQVATGRQIVQTLLAGRIILTPLLSPTERQYQMTVNLTLGGFFQGILDPRAVVAPVGLSSNSIRVWLDRIDQLRRVA